MNKNPVDKTIEDNGLVEQLSVFENDGKLLIRTSEKFNQTDELQQNQIISTVVDVLLKSNKTETLLTVGLNENSEVTLKFLDNFGMLSLHSQEYLLKKVSGITRKMAEMKESEKVNNSEWIN